ncbi:polyprenol phosphomannose-dependent alpha 1,6 mannosyltransferase MptB [Herbiconiux sp. P15]|uniref:polyprenol phosphomannose-dependent alpha 1,6 mannosyltransferase MptB n=1 Tax=Herbiconiux liukaitaii TaxID=3342799 RepID=UPI0035BA88C2
MPSLSPRIRLLIGLAGAIAMTLGSYGVGWIAPLSGLHDIGVLEAVRHSRGAVLACGLLVAGGAVMLFTAWLALGLDLLSQRRRVSGDPAADASGSASVRTIAVSAATWSLPLLFSLPLFSRDMFAYLAQGRLVAAGFNPYENGVSSVPGWFGIGVDPLWADTATPYGPVFVWIERVVATVTEGFPHELGVFAFRLVAVAGLAMLAYFAWRIAHLRGRDASVVLWLVAASPLALMNFVVAGHNDSLMLGLIAAGIFYALDRRPVLGAVLIGLAIGVKPIAIVALPIVGLIWAITAAGPGVRPAWGAVVRRWAAVTGIALGGIAVLGFALGVGVGWVAALATPATISSWYAPANIVGIALGGMANGVGIDGEIVQTVVKIALLAGGCAVAAFLLIRRRDADPLLLLLGCFAAITLVSPVIHPWYALWLLVFLAFAGIDGVKRLRVAVYSTAFFMIIGLAEPLDLVSQLDGSRLIPTAVIGASLAGITALLLTAEGAYGRLVLPSGVRSRARALAQARAVSAASRPSV